MEEKKTPLPPLMGEKLPSYASMPREMNEIRRRSFSSCLLFLILGASVLALACFALYTVISTQTTSNESAQALEKVQNEVAPTEETLGSRRKPFFGIELEINGKKFPGIGDAKNKTEISITNRDEPHNFMDEFSTLRNLFNTFSGLDNRPTFFRPTPEKDSLSQGMKKPKIITVESWEIRRLPKEFPPNPPRTFTNMFNAPQMDDILDTFFNPPQRETKRPRIMTTPKNNVENRKEIYITPVFPPIRNTPKMEKQVDRIRFPDFEDMLSDIFDEKPDVSFQNKNNWSKPKVSSTKFESSRPFVIPFEPFNTKSREEVEVFKKVEKPYLDRYAKNKAEKKTDADDTFRNKFIGDKPKYSQKQKTFVERPPSIYSDEGSPFFFYNNAFMPTWPKYPKKYQSKTLANVPSDKNISENKTSQTTANTTQEEVKPYTTPSPTVGNSFPQKIMQ